MLELKMTSHEDEGIVRWLETHTFSARYPGQQNRHHGRRSVKLHTKATLFTYDKAIVQLDQQN